MRVGVPRAMAQKAHAHSTSGFCIKKTACRDSTNILARGGSLPWVEGRNLLNANLVDGHISARARCKCRLAFKAGTVGRVPVKFDHRAAVDHIEVKL